MRARVVDAMKQAASNKQEAVRDTVDLGMYAGSSAVGLATSSRATNRMGATEREHSRSYRHA